MPEYVEPNSEMDAFFALPRITHRKTRNWPTPGGQRHWYSIDPKLTIEETRNLLECLPIGAYAQSFYWKYDSPSDSGAWVEIQRYPDFWTAACWNSGWSSYQVPIAVESAARLFWDGLLVDTLYFMGYQRKREPKATTEHMAHSGLSHDLPEQFAERINPQIVNHIKRRAAEIDGTKQTSPDPHSG